MLEFVGGYITEERGTIEVKVKFSTQVELINFLNLTFVRTVVPKFFLCADHLKYFSAPRRWKIDFYCDWRTTWANIADHQWSEEQTLGITALELDIMAPIRVREVLHKRLNHECFHYEHAVMWKLGYGVVSKWRHGPREGVSRIMWRHYSHICNKIV